MKALKLSTVGILLSLLISTNQSCKKDKNTALPMDPPATNFSEIKMSHIQTKEPAMASNEIVASDKNGVLWQVKDVYVFRTNEKRYGKFQVLNINMADNYALTIKAIVYNTDGSEKLSINTLKIRGTWLCDLDLLIESDINSDFFWERNTKTDTNLEPRNEAKFAKYIF
ncbi:MAG: hypothetical protein ACKVOW_03305 [Chitinophagaceae bacterium]